MSLRIRLTLAFVLVALVAILSLVVFVRMDTAQQVQQYMFRGGLVGAENLVSRLESYYSSKGSWQGVEFMMSPSGGMMGMMDAGRGQGLRRQRIQLADSSGRLLYDNNTDGAQLPPLTSQEMQQAIPLEDRNSQVVGFLLINGGLSVPVADTTPLLQRLNGAAFRAAMVSGGIALVLALLLAASLLRPIEQLTRAAERLSKGNLDYRVTVHSTDELGTLGQAFNAMTESLQRSEERRKAMTADIAHELRTPLSVQRAQLEALQDGIYPLEPENLQPLLDQNVMLSRLVEDLRTLALADAGELHLDDTWVEVEPLVERALEKFRPAAEAHHITMQVRLANLPAPCPKLWGDPLRLEQILTNLLSNALRYTPDGGKITLDAAYQGGSVEISVRDSGPGIPEDALPHVFERFYRVERSRSRDEGGSGLGLAIARQLANAHDGQLNAANYPGGGAVFTLRLPVMAGGEESAAE